MHATPDESIGKRVARLRNARHLTQAGLAGAAHLSVSMISAIERGERQPSEAAIASLARALIVPVAEIKGQPYVQQLRDEQLDALIQPIREAIDVYDLGPDPDITPRPVAEIGSDADELCRLMRATQVRTVATALPGLISEATTAAHLAPSDQAWAVLASTYRSAYDTATKLGYQDLAATCLDRMGWAAERASDPVLAAARQYMRALQYLRTGEFRTGRRLLDIGHKTLAQAPAGLERDAVAGQMYLCGAVLAARAQDRAAAQDFLTEAEQLAERTGEAPHVHHLSWGPTNVAYHRVSAMTELDEYADAVTVAQSIVTPQGFPISRQAHHVAEVARAQLYSQRVDQAWNNLLLARQMAPQQARYSPTVRAAVEGVLEAKRSTPNTLVNYATWVGLV
jgi:transcriptional regulator with XRE-family HTH domain